MRRAYFFLPLAAVLLSWGECAEADEYKEHLERRHHELATVEGSHFDLMFARMKIDPGDLEVLASGPVLVQVADPLGRVATREKSGIPGSRFGRGEFSKVRDGAPDRVISIPVGADYGTYQITVSPDSTALRDDTFVLEIYVKGYLVEQVSDLRIKDIPSAPYAVELRNVAPDILASLLKSYRVGEETSIRINTLDIEKQKVAVELTKGPPGMKLEPRAQGSPELVWTPTMDDLGNHEVILVARDEEGGVSERRRTIGVILPPVQGFKARVERGRVILTWEPLPGVTGYTIHATELADAVALNVQGTRYVDTDVKPGENRTYTIYAIDRTGVTGACSIFIPVRGE